MSDELKVTKTAVVEAAKACPDARKVLEKLFPEAFGPTLRPGMIVRPKYHMNHLYGDVPREQAQYRVDGGAEWLEAGKDSSCLGIFLRLL